MQTVSRDSAPQVLDRGPVVERTGELGEYTVNFVSLREDIDLAPLLKGLPDDSCQCPHWGYLFNGQITVRYADHEEICLPGDAFYMSPGHIPVAVAGSEFVQFSPTAELRVVEEAMAKNMDVVGGTA